MSDPADWRIMRLFTLGEHDSPGDFQPEIHVVGLSSADVAAVVALLGRLGRVTDHGTVLTADGITIQGAELPDLSMFVTPDAVQFFWDAGPPWTERSAAAFVELLGQVLDVAPNARLRPDPLLLGEIRREVAEALGERLGRPERVELG